MKPGIYDVVIIGAGIVGCALARELASRFDSVVLLEKEASVGFHTSGRNSGVVHSGFNPKPGTLKARLCVQGSQALRLFCAERGVPCEQVGTWVVATSRSEEHTSELQSQSNLVCRLLLEKKKKNTLTPHTLDSILSNNLTPVLLVVSHVSVSSDL